MADKKISQLNAAATPLAGTEVLPIVQSGATVKVSVADLTSGRTVTASNISAGLGAVGTPSYTFTGDLNTGIFSPAADTIAFAEGGVEAARFNSAGNFGVGTTNPGGRIHAETTGNAIALFDTTDTTGGTKFVGIRSTAVSGTATPTLALRQWRTSFAGNQNVAEIRFDGLTTTGGYTEFASIYAVCGVNTASGAPTSITFQTTNSSFVTGERMRVNANGEVAIGTSSPNPAAQLDVSSTTRGLLPPRMTTAQRDLIATPPDGLMLYNTSTNKLQVRAASAWVDLH